jgi:hypothetical protein
VGGDDDESTSFRPINPLAGGGIAAAVALRSTEQKRRKVGRWAWIVMAVKVSENVVRKHSRSSEMRMTGFCLRV